MIFLIQFPERETDYVVYGKEYENDHDCDPVSEEEEAVPVVFIREGTDAVNGDIAQIEYAVKGNRQHHQPVFLSAHFFRIPENKLRNGKKRDQQVKIINWLRGT